ncbi:hypothetical protein G7Y89_g3859 [Cudoniella acicularis]|uniref:Auxiliary Activity family 9 catalytic domain-containing protein n=1 Tax=Cudoniella acicularis TaxID=354080 RepID=A0A8H4RSP5_9HELO|nr:hypothetical protein G7Y89_g3859 [Cudoniella acicularis]
MLSITLITAIFSYAVSVNSHCFVANITVGRVTYVGINEGTLEHPAVMPQWLQRYPAPYEKTWSYPMDYFYNASQKAVQNQNPDMACGHDSTPGQTYVPVKAGSNITFWWTNMEHPGPILTYLAACNGSCSTVDKTKLKFFKIDETGEVKAQGKSYWDGWATWLISYNNYTWASILPSDIAAGNYVVRHEILALHNEMPQVFLACFNLRISRSGNNIPVGVAAAELYHDSDIKVLSQLVASPSWVGYKVPGPPLEQAIYAWIANASAASRQRFTAAQLANRPSPRAAPRRMEPERERQSPRKIVVPSTPPMMGSSSYDADARAEDFSDAGFYDDDKSAEGTEVGGPLDRNGSISSGMRGDVGSLYGERVVR